MKIISQSDTASSLKFSGPDFEYSPPEVEGCPPPRPVSELARPPSPEQSDKVNKEEPEPQAEEGAEKQAQGNENTPAVELS